MKKAELRRGAVIFLNEKAGIIEETEEGFRFTYDREFVKKKRSIAVSLPIDRRVYESVRLFSFFLGLLPEGWYLDMVAKKLKIDERDVFGLLLAACKETIGAVSIEELG